MWKWTGYAPQQTEQQCHVQATVQEEIPEDILCHLMAGMAPASLYQLKTAIARSHSSPK